MARSAGVSVTPAWMTFERTPWGAHSLWHEQLQVAEGDRVQEDANPPVAAERLGEALEALLARCGLERVGVHGHQRDAVAADRVELGLDARHCAAPIAVYEEAIH